MDVFKKFATDPKAEEEGVWEDLGGGAKLRICRIGNPRYKELFRRLSAPHQTQIDLGILDEAMSEEITTRCLAETILVDWMGMTWDDQPFPYNKENALKVLALKDFRAFVLGKAVQAESFRLKKLEGLEKNSVPASAGSSETAGT